MSDKQVIIGSVCGGVVLLLIGIFVVNRATQPSIAHSEPSVPHASRPEDPVVHPAPPPISTAQSSDNPPSQPPIQQIPTDGNEAQFRDFTIKFSTHWQLFENQNLRQDKTFTSSLYSVDKKKSDSLLHPAIWVAMGHDLRVFPWRRDEWTFNFYWDGHRFVGLDSESKIVEDEVLPEGVGEVMKLSEATIDDWAKSSQR